MSSHLSYLVSYLQVSQLIFCIHFYIINSVRSAQLILLDFIALIFGKSTNHELLTIFSSFPLLPLLNAVTNELSPWSILVVHELSPWSILVVHELSPWSILVVRELSPWSILVVHELSPWSILVVRETKATYSLARYAMLLCEKVILLNTKRDECWLMGYRIRYHTSPDPTHAFYTASTCMCHDSACFSRITMHAFKYTLSE
jgi:hypothetical protein